METLQILYIVFILIWCWTTICFQYSHSPSWNGLQPPAHAGSSLKDFSTLKMEVICTSETFVQTRYTRRHIPEDGTLHSHRRETSNLKRNNIQCCQRKFFQCSQHKFYTSVSWCFRYSAHPQHVHLPSLKYRTKTCTRPATSPLQI
jgi:hypothetical protein